MYERILVPLDGTGVAEAALPFMDQLRLAQEPRAAATRRRKNPRAIA